jgi:hypothetical protein
MRIVSVEQSYDREKPQLEFHLDNDDVIIVNVKKCPKNTEGHEENLLEAILAMYYDAADDDETLDVEVYLQEAGE